MGKFGIAVCALVVLAALVAAPSTVRAQIIVPRNSVTDWTNQGLNPQLETNTTSGNVFGLTRSISSPGGRAVRMQLGASAEENADGTPDRFTYSMVSRQRFTLSEAGLVSLPMYLNGFFSFMGNTGPPSRNFGMGSVAGSIEVFTDSTTPGTFDVSRFRSDFDPPSMGDGSVVNGDQSQPFDRFRLRTSDLLPARTYELVARLQITGDAHVNPNIPGLNGSRTDVTAAGADSSRLGFAGNFAAVPDGLDNFNSRDAVTAPAGAPPHGLNGAGVKVGVFEAGVPYRGHAALPDSRLIVRNGTSPPTSSEHANAVAGIIAGMHADSDKAGIAPAATIVAASSSSFSFSEIGAIRDLIDQGCRVINHSADNPFDSRASYDRVLAQNPLVTFCQAAGNDGIDFIFDSDVAGAYNVLTVGSANRDFTKRSEFSNYVSDRFPRDSIRHRKPDIMAPGEYILAPSVRNASGEGQPSEFRRIFLGDAYQASGVTTGAVVGTSFATPHVAGAAALLNQAANTRFASLAHAADHRVIKAVLMAGASTTIKHANGDNWAQAGATGDFTAGSPRRIPESLDRETGAGMLDSAKALSIYAAGEVRSADLNGNRNLVIPAQQGPRFWDYERVGAQNADPNMDGRDDGTVDYLLGPARDSVFRACLTWDATVSMNDDMLVYDPLAVLQLQFWREGAGENRAGFDPAAPLADFKLAETTSTVDNVKLFDFRIPDVAGNYYLEVRNLSRTAVVYGVAVTVPGQGAGGGLVLFGVVWLCRRSRRERDPLSWR